MLDDECGKKCDEDEWQSRLEEETEEERNERRKIQMFALVKQLPALLADKAISLYRQGRRSTSR